MLKSGKAEYEKRTKEFAMMEATDIEKIESEPSPRVFNTHLPLRLLSGNVKEKKVKVIHLYRNVKDVFVSLYFHIKQYVPDGSLTFEMVENYLFKECAGEHGTKHIT